MTTPPQIRLGDVVRHRKSFVTIDDAVEYKRCRVQLHAQGVVLRDIVAGSLIKTKSQQVCKAGDLLVAEIDAKHGGFGLVPPALAGAVVSSHYFLFELDGTRVDPSFLSYALRSRAFRDQVEAQGSTNYAAIRPSDVLEYELPSFTLPDQRRVAKWLSQVEKSALRALSLRDTSLGAARSLSASESAVWFRTDSKSRVRLGDVVRVIDPNPSHRYPQYADDGIPIVSSSDFEGENEIGVSRAKRVPVAFYEATLGRFSVTDGDVVFSRKGKIGYARAHPADRLAMTHTLCILQPDRARVDPNYLLQFARSQPFLDYLASAMNPNVGVPTLGLDVIRDAPFPCPDVSDQIRLAAQFCRTTALNSQLLSTLERATGELSALFPAVLEEALGARHSACEPPHMAALAG
jgi:type I restriction enzyme, S subunit